MSIDLKEFLDETQFAVMVAIMNSGRKKGIVAAVEYLNHLAAAQNDIDQCTLVNRLRNRIEERDAFDLTYGVYDDLLPAEKEAAR